MKPLGVGPPFDCSATDRLFLARCGLLFLLFFLKKGSDVSIQYACRSHDSRSSEKSPKEVSDLCLQHAVRSLRSIY